MGVSYCETLRWAIVDDPCFRILCSEGIPCWPGAVHVDPSNFGAVEVSDKTIVVVYVKEQLFNPFKAGYLEASAQENRLRAIGNNSGIIAIIIADSAGPSAQLVSSKLVFIQVLETAPVGMR